jgi:hypothetical protein
MIDKVELYIRSNIPMKIIKTIFPVLVVSLFIFACIFTSSCDDYKSEEFEISDPDSKACQQLQKEDSLGVDTVQVVSLASFDSTIAVDTMLYNQDTVLVDTTIYFTWTHEMIYDSVNAIYKYVPEIIDSLVANEIVITNTSADKFKLITPGAIDTVYIALQTNSASLTFFFDNNVSINIINQAGETTGISNKTMPLETAAGCTKYDEDKKVEIPLIQARLEIAVPGNNSLLQLIKHEQTRSRIIHVSIL